MIDIHDYEIVSESIPILQPEQIIPTLDIAVLKPEATLLEISEAAREVEEIGAASVCVASYNVAVAKQVTQRVTSVIGFPHGNMSPEIKRLEAMRAIEDGAIELDIVINFGRFLEGREVAVCQELDAVVNLALHNGVLVKAILETCYYDPTQIRDASALCVVCDVDWLKTSTGFGPGGATPLAVKLMLEATKTHRTKKPVQVKASGGIKTYTDACMYLGMGCTRLGVGFTNYRKLLS